MSKRNVGLGLTPPSKYRVNYYGQRPLADHGETEAEPAEDKAGTRRDKPKSQAPEAGSGRDTNKSDGDALDIPDYNAVHISVFKTNPAKYLAGMGTVPLLIRRYGHIQAVVLPIDKYNEQLERIRLLKIDVTELRKLLDAVSPHLHDALAKMPRSWDVEDLYPKWPLIKNVSRLKPRARTVADSDLKWFREEAAAYLEEISGAYKLPDSDSDDDWGRGAVIRNEREGDIPMEAGRPMDADDDGE